MDATLKAILNTHNLSNIKPDSLAQMLTYLIEHEVAVGGPYAFSNDVDSTAANAHISKVFHSSVRPGAAKGSRRANQTILEPIKAALYRRAHSEMQRGTNGITKKTLEQIVEKIQITDNGEVSMLSRVFYESLRADCIPALNNSPKVLRSLAVANIITWCGYSLLDSILDGSSSSKPGHEIYRLPLILHCQRLAMYHYLQAGVDYLKVLDIFNTVDNTNARELALRKFVLVDTASDTITIRSIPDTKVLHRIMSAKSIAHVLGPLVLIHSDIPRIKKDILRALKKYCTARQYQDDLHDWVDDLRNGHVSYVVARLLNEAQIKPGSYSLSSLTAKLRVYYWETVLSASCDEIEELIAQSADILEDTVLKPNSQFVRNVLEPIAHSAHKAKVHHEHNKAFVAALHS